MTDERTVKFYTAAFSAWRESDGQVTIQTTPAIVLAFSDEDAKRQGMDGAFAAFPTSEGWRDHQVIYTEIPKELTFEGYRLTWRVDKIP